MIDVGKLTGVDLATVQLSADLQTRFDRKYILDPTLLQDLIENLGGGLAALEIDGARHFAYESVYFDTPLFDSYFGAAHGRRQRFKVRTRSYVDVGDCVLELKSAGGRGHTVKVRRPHQLTERFALDEDSRAFLAGHGLPAGVIPALRPTLTTSYFRMTLLGRGFRCTVDTDLRCADTTGRERRLRGKVLVETKSSGHATDVDRALWRSGIRPLAVSKYATGLAALCPELPSNKWHRTLARHFDDSR